MDLKTKHLLIGALFILTGGALMMFTKGIELPIISLDKLGLVFVVIGIVDLGYAIYLKSKG